MVTLTNPDYPHTAVITRTANAEHPPFTATTSTLWSGAVDCQTGNTGSSFKRESVFVSDYIIYSEQINVELQQGDLITVTKGTGSTPINCTIQQSSTEDVWEVDGKKYGTTIWANRVNA